MNVYFHTFGCKANQYDTERVREAFDAGGAVVVDDPALADLAVINSCTVTNDETPRALIASGFGGGKNSNLSETGNSVSIARPSLFARASKCGRW